LKTRFTRAAIGSLVAAAGAVVALPGSAAQAATCVPAGATGLTAALVATAGQTIASQTIDAAGCDVGIYVGPTATGVTISGTTVSNANLHGVYARDTSGLTVSGSTVQNNGLHPNSKLNEDKALQLDGVSNSTVKNNTVQNNVDDGAIGINDDGPVTPGAPNPGPAQPVRSVNVTVTGNNMPNNIGSGCDLVVAGYNAGGGTDHISLTNNQIVGHPGEVGSTGVFVGQIVLAGDGPGVSNTATTISGNNIVGSALAGIVLHANAPGDVIDGTVITGNNVSLNHWATPFGPPELTGIAIQAEDGPPGAVPVVSNTTLSGNTINQQYYAIWLKGSTPGLHIGANNISVTPGGVAVFHKPDAFAGDTMVGSDGGILTLGRARYAGSIPGSGIRTFGSVVGMAASRDDNGYWIATTAGAVYDFGDATSSGSLLSTGVKPASPVVGIVATPANGNSTGGIGYYLFTRNGVVYPFGDAQQFGSLPSQNLTAPIVGMAVTSTGAGYWLVSATGGVFSFGDARFHGSLGGKHLSPPIVGIGASPTDGGYYLVGADGGVFTFGDAHFYGSTGNLHLAAPVVGIVLGPERPFAGPPPAGGPPPPTPAGGYALVARDGGVFTFGNAPFLGSGAGKHDGTAILGMSTTQ
jgi:parallel beta-helix repeat protein